MTCLCDHNGPFDVDNERARQAALGHRMLQEAAAVIAEFGRCPYGCVDDQSDPDPCWMCAIVAELRGGK